MNVNYFFRLAIAFSAMAGLVACDTDSDEPEDDGKAVIKHTQDKDTLYVDYNGTLDLSTVFTLEQSAKGVAKLAYKVERQPDYAEGNSEEFTTVDAYGISGSVLSAIPGVRVPDAVNKEDRVRVVREGKLKVSVEGAKEEVEPLVFTIVMKDKPALVPVITLSEGLAEKLTGGKLVLENVGQYHLFTANSFTISPIDFGIEDIRIGIGAGSYIITSPSGVPQAGGSGSATGTGGYVVAYYKENTLEEVLANENLPQVRVNVDVELGEATEIVGIIPNTAALGTKGNASFWRNNANGRQALSGFVLVQFDNGTTAPYDATTHNLSLLAGDFDSYLEGRTTQDQEHPGWWLYVALKQNEALPSVGTTVSFKITSGLHFGEPAWTATITTQTTSANPETL